MLLSDEKICEACPACNMRTCEQESLRCEISDCIVHPDFKRIAKAQFLALVKWLMEPCPKTQHSSPIGTKRINCPDCMAELKAEAKRINE